MPHHQLKTIALAGLYVAAVVGLSACSNDTSSPAASPGTSTAPPMTNMSVAPAASNLVGPGCASYAQQVPTGPGSVEGMAQDPVAVAASNNPLLTTLTSAVSGKLNPNVNLVETLNNGQYTVFAPTDDAFKKLPQFTIDTLKTRLWPANEDPHLPRGAGPGVARQGGRYAPDLAGFGSERHRNG